MSRTDSGLTKNVRAVPFKPGPDQNLNRKPSPRKSTLIYRKHKPPDKKLIFSPPAFVNMASYSLEQPLLPSSVQDDVTSPIRKSEKSVERPSASQVGSKSRLLKGLLSPRMEEIAKPYLYRSRNKEFHVKSLSVSKAPRLCYYDEGKKKKLQRKNIYGLQLPEDNYSLEPQSSILAVELGKSSRELFKEKTMKRLESAVQIGEPFAIRRMLSQRSIANTNKKITDTNKNASSSTVDMRKVYSEWGEYNGETASNNLNDAKYAMEEIDRLDSHVEVNRTSWLPSTGLTFLSEERAIQKLLESNDDPMYDKIFEKYRPAAKPGSEADQFRNKSLARMGLLVDIKKLKLQTLANKWRNKARMSTIMKKKMIASVKQDAEVEGLPDESRSKEIEQHEREEREAKSKAAEIEKQVEIMEEEKVAD